jgi:hypothetical protein
VTTIVVLSSGGNGSLRMHYDPRIPFGVIGQVPADRVAIQGDRDDFRVWKDVFLKTF